jgi:hypothetical protein
VQPQVGGYEVPHYLLCYELQKRRVIREQRSGSSGSRPFWCPGCHHCHAMAFEAAVQQRAVQAQVRNDAECSCTMPTTCKPTVRNCVSSKTEVLFGDERFQEGPIRKSLEKCPFDVHHYQQSPTLVLHQQNQMVKIPKLCYCANQVPHRFCVTCHGPTCHVPLFSPSRPPPSSLLDCSSSRPRGAQERSHRQGF